MNRVFNTWSCARLIFCVSAQSVWGQADENAKLVEGAKKESKLVWYTSTNVTEAKPARRFEKSSLVKGERSRAAKGLIAFVKGAIGRRKPRASSRSSKIPTATGRRSTLTNYATIGYNPTLVSEKEAPKQWEDLLDPKWKGKFANVCHSRRAGDSERDPESRGCWAWIPIRVGNDAIGSLTFLKRPRRDT